MLDSRKRVSESDRICLGASADIFFPRCRIRAGFSVLEWVAVTLPAVREYLSRIFHAAQNHSPQCTTIERLSLAPAVCCCAAWPSAGRATPTSRLAIGRARLFLS